MPQQAAREKDIEAYLKKLFTARGWLVYKFTSPGNIGVPDRLLISPQGVCLFVEVKSARGRLSAAQKKQLARLSACNAFCRVIYSKEDAEGLLDEFG